MVTRLKDHLGQGLPEDPSSKEDENSAVRVQHDGNVTPRLEQSEGEEAVGQEEEVVKLANERGAETEGAVRSQERLEPGAGVQHWEELFLEVYNEEFAEERNVVAAVIAVPDGEESKST